MVFNTGITPSLLHWYSPSWKESGAICQRFLELSKWTSTSWSSLSKYTTTLSSSRRSHAIGFRKCPQKRSLGKITKTEHAMWQIAKVEMCYDVLSHYWRLFAGLARWYDTEEKHFIKEELSTQQRALYPTLVWLEIMNRWSWSWSGR